MLYFPKTYFTRDYSDQSTGSGLGWAAEQSSSAGSQRSVCYLVVQVGGNHEARSQSQLPVKLQKNTEDTVMTLYLNRHFRHLIEQTLDFIQSLFRCI